MMTLPAHAGIFSWDKINTVLDSITTHSYISDPSTDLNASSLPVPLFPRAIAFITFNYGIDGVTIEIAKYAQCLAELFKQEESSPPIHFIGGNFFQQADQVIPKNAPRLKIPHFDGWDKWQQGRWFQKLFFEPMPSDSSLSNKIATEIWHQALTSAGQLIRYIQKKNIDLLIPVNVNSNPGNLASALAIVLASEITGVNVLNSNHDFFWEGGCPKCKKQPNASPGIRDHFFTNYENKPFLKLFQRILPWNGKKWLQLNINDQQIQSLGQQYGIPSSRLFPMGTCIDDAFFTRCPPEKKAIHRLKMTHILSRGDAIIKHPTPVSLFLKQMDHWMTHQTPIICGADDASPLDITTPHALFLLQPTRIVARKRIFRDWELIEALFSRTDFKLAFDSCPERTLTIHITGPVPMEHQADLEKILLTFKKLQDSLPQHIARRLFTSFSVGHDFHESFTNQGFHRLGMDEIYKMADMIFLPSKTEGRGLPILEGGASGIPVVCSRYEPEKTFSEVIGEHLPPALKIHHIPFPEHHFPLSMLNEIKTILLHPETYSAHAQHNRRAVSARYNTNALQCNFNDAINNLALRHGQVAN
ncbi:MAG: glycosyltransferase [Desulfotalea sp.]